tara:strand:+ start:23 stop:511 length:489 start_codon:yes stop_codon:yes gene_type:complete
MTKKQEKVWAYKIKHPKATTKQIAKDTNSSVSYVHKLMSKIGTPKDVQAKTLEETIESWKGVSRETEVKEDTVRQAILDKAAYLIDGDRANDYGDAQDNFERIATYWNTHLGLIELITPTDVGIMMTLLKVARLHGEVKSIDSFVDVCGYMALAGEMAPARK